MSETFEQWAVLEIMGHQRYAGRVTEETIAGAAMLRMDIPAVGDCQAFTKYFGSGAVYAMTIVSQEIATGLAARFQKTPINVYELPADLQQRLEFQHANDDDEEEFDPDD